MKSSKYNKLKSLKAVSRKRVGSPPAARVLVERSLRERPKHKKPILGQEDDL